MSSSTIGMDKSSWEEQHTQGINTHTHTHTPAPPTRALQKWAIWRCRLTWSQRAICRVFQRETPVVSSRFMLPRNTTRFTRWFLQLACWGNKDRASYYFCDLLNKERMWQLSLSSFFVSWELNINAQDQLKFYDYHLSRRQPGWFRIHNGILWMF